MIIKGKSRAGGRALGVYLTSQGKNERITVVEVRGTVARDVLGAMLEMDAFATGTKCTRGLYHAIINPAPGYVLTDEQRKLAVDTLEECLKLNGHPRIVVAHVKEGHEHLHVVWSRIDLERMRAVSDSHSYRRHEEAARKLERLFGHDRVQGAHHERAGFERPDRTPSRSELRQEERTGIKGKHVKAEVTALFQGSDNASAFQAALEDAGYLVAKGDRRDFVIIDRAGGTHSLARRIAGVNAAGLREFMSPLDREAFPSASQAVEMQAARIQGERSESDKPVWEDALAEVAIHKGANERAEEGERKRQLREDRRSNKLEAAYSKGEGYESQTRAALRDHKERQKRLDRLLAGGDGNSRERGEGQQLEVPGGGRTRSR